MVILEYIIDLLELSVCSFEEILDLWCSVSDVNKIYGL